jgi:LysR family glycine cleavage system transcriptional activator
MTEELIVVGSSQLLPGARRLLEPEEILRRPLLHDEYHCGWEEWAKLAGIDLPINAHSPVLFADTGLLLEAAVASEGVALARSSLAADDINAGRLMQLSRITLPVRDSLYFVCQPEDLRTPVVAQFREWVVDEILRSERRVFA